jgi:ribosomal protein L34E
MSGSIDNNDAITNDLLSAINAALQGSKQCTTQNVENCPASKRNPDTPYGDMGCQTQQL